MTTDIVEILRERAKEGHAFDQDMDDAADEIEDWRRQFEDERQAHLVCIEMRNDAEAERDRMREALKQVRCPGGGWNGMPKDMEPTVQNCMAHDACGCIYGDVLRSNEQLKQND